MKEELNIGWASAAWNTSVASVDDEDDSGWSLITTGDFFTGFHAGDGWYGTIVDWSIALQLKRLKELLVLRCVDLLGFCSIPFGVCSIDLVLWSALLRRRSVLFLGRSLRPPRLMARGLKKTRTTGKWDIIFIFLILLLWRHVSTCQLKSRYQIPKLTSSSIHQSAVYKIGFLTKLKKIFYKSLSYTLQNRF